MAEVCEIQEQKHLRGNRAIRKSLGRFMPITNETTTLRVAAEHSKPKSGNEYATELIGYCCIGVSTMALPIKAFDFQIVSGSFYTCVDVTRVIDEKVLIEQNFETRVWSNLTSLLKVDREESALVYLYQTLHDELGNIANCDSFLGMSVGMQMNSDVIVHILNALSPIKSKLKNWEAFELYSFKLLQKEVGEQTAKILFGAIV